MANEDQDPDQIPDFEPESDFSEFEEEKPKASFGDTVKNNPLAKLGLIAVGLIVVVGAIMMFGGEEQKQKNSSTGRASDLKETPGTAELSPVMKDAMDEFNEQNLETAINTGGSVMPIPTEPPKSFLPAPTDAAAAEDPLQRWRQMQEERLRVQREQEQMQSQTTSGAGVDPEVQQAIDGLAAAMSAQGTEILSKLDQHTVTSMEITGPEFLDKKDELPGAASGVLLGPDGQPIVPKKALEMLIPAGTILYAQLLNEANSDIPGPLVALLAQGPFSGSRVLGTFSRREELLFMEFSTLVTKEGFSIPINAIAMDPDTTLTAMATDVDHRYWRRIILPAAAEFVTGVGEAIAESGTTTVEVTSTSGTSATTDNSNLDTEQELAKGAEKSFQKVSELLSEEADDVEILVIVRAGTPMGLLFMQGITKAMAEDARYGTAQGPQNGEQQDQQQGGNPLLGLLGMNANGQQQGQNGAAGQQDQQGGMMDSLLQTLQSQQNVQNGNTQSQY